MNKFELIYRNVEEIEQKVIKNKPVVIRCKGSNFTGKTLKYILGKIKFLKKYKLLELNIFFEFGTISFADKITYILFDMLLYDLYKTTKFKLNIDMKLEKKIVHNGIQNTAFCRTINEYGALERAGFVKEYERKLYIAPNHYRKYMKRSCLDKQPSALSVIASEIESFLKQHFDDLAWVSDVCEAIGELIDNTFSHTKSDCFVDIDVCRALDEGEQEFKALNIAIINFSEQRIFDGIKRNIIGKKYSPKDPLYRGIYKAYDNHRPHFCDDYGENDFFHITAFQNGVTSRRTVSGNSGTGLTTLIKNIVGKTTDNYSYVLSGDNILFFIEEYLDIDEAGKIGFNKENDYQNVIPDSSVITKSGLFIPGTIFLLSLMRNDYGKQN